MLLCCTTPGGMTGWIPVSQFSFYPSNDFGSSRMPKILGIPCFGGIPGHLNGNSGDSERSQGNWDCRRVLEIMAHSVSEFIPFTVTLKEARVCSGMFGGREGQPDSCD